MKSFDEIYALATSPLHAEYAENFTDHRLSWGVGVTQGVAVAMQEAQAEIDALKAENKRLQEKSEHSTIARFNWRNKYLTLIRSIIAILGLDDLTARDDVVLAVEALKSQNAELLAAQEGAPCKHKFNAVVSGVLSCTHCHASFSEQQVAIAKARGES